MRVSLPRLTFSEETHTMPVPIPEVVRKCLPLAWREGHGDMGVDLRRDGGGTWIWSKYTGQNSQRILNKILAVKKLGQCLLIDSKPCNNYEAFAQQTLEKSHWESHHASHRLPVLLPFLLWKDSQGFKSPTDSGGARLCSVNSLTLAGVTF